MSPLDAPTRTAPSATSTTTAVALAPGDGIGPEITDAVVFALHEAGARLDLRPVRIGEALYRAGHSSGIDDAAWRVIRDTGLVLKGPITTPSGGGVKSLNVTLRKALGLFANVRPCRTYAPALPTRHPDLDIVVVRENEEDTYGGIEHRQTAQVTQCLKLITQPGTESIVRYAFELARAQGRRKVTCMTKANIMKLTDGLFREEFTSIAQEYPELEAEHQIIDIGTARIATRPQDYDVVVCPNLYGDIVSDVVAEVAGSVGLAGSVNVGRAATLFEAIHGSAPDIAGRDLANPSGLLLAALQLLLHVGQPDPADALYLAWLRTLEDGLHTPDLAHPGTHRRVGTQAFIRAVVDRLGQSPRRLAASGLGSLPAPPPPPTLPEVTKQRLGVDVFLDWTGGTPQQLGDRLQRTGTDALRLSMITNRGVQVWPHGLPETFCTDHWRCRFTHPSDDPVSQREVLALLERLVAADFDVIKTEGLFAFDGRPGFSLGQGQ